MKKTQDIARFFRRLEFGENEEESEDSEADV